MLRLSPRSPRPRPALPPGRRVYAIGDIHGCADRLDGLLACVERDAATRAPMRTTLIYLGDLIDRGPDSAGAITRAMRPPDWAESRVLMGNHEAAMLAALDGDMRMLDLWLTNGGIAALPSWGIDPQEIETMTADAIIALLRDRIPADHRAWLARRPLSIRIGDYLFVHAGIRPGVALDCQTVDDLLWIREDFLDSRRLHGVIVVHGHSIAPTVIEKSNRIGIDTGAYLGGPLTAIGLEGEARWLLRS